MTRSQNSGVVSTNGTKRSQPATLTSTSIGPRSVATAPTRVSDGLGVGDVEPDPGARRRTSAPARVRSGQGLEVDDHDAVAGHGEPPTDRRADRAGAAGDHGDSPRARSRRPAPTSRPPTPRASPRPRWRARRSGPRTATRPRRWPRSAGSRAADVDEMPTCRSCSRRWYWTASGLAPGALVRLHSSRPGCPRRPATRIHTSIDRCAPNASNKIELVLGGVDVTAASSSVRRQTAAFVDARADRTEGVRASSMGVWRPSARLHR